MPKGEAFHYPLPGGGFKRFRPTTGSTFAVPRTVTATPINNTTATLAWTEPTQTSPAITGYRVTRDGVDANGSGVYSTVVPATARSFTFLSLVAMQYNLSVSAIYGTAGESSSVVKPVTIAGSTGGTVDGGPAPQNPTLTAEALAHTPSTSWVVDFIDDFDDVAVTTSKWNINRDAYDQNSGWLAEGGSGLEIPAAGQLPAAMQMRNSAAYLYCKRVTNPSGRPFGGIKMTTARPNLSGTAPKWVTEENGTYFAEARLWCGRAKGSWNAFWFLGDTYSGDPTDVYDNPTTQSTYTQHWDGQQSGLTPSAGWPTGGEVDMLEFPDNNVGDMDKPFVSLHYSRSRNENITPPFPGHWLYREFQGHPDSFAVARPDLRNSWHTWGIYRSPFLMIHYIDGIELCRWHRFQGGTPNNPATSGARQVYTAWDGPHTPSQVLWTKPMFLFMSQVMGMPNNNDSWSGQGFTSYDQFEEAEMRLGYVKVWKKAAA